MLGVYRKTHTTVQNRTGDFRPRKKATRPGQGEANGVDVVADVEDTLVVADAHEVATKQRQEGAQAPGVGWGRGAGSGAGSRGG